MVVAEKDANMFGNKAPLRRSSRQGLDQASTWQYFWKDSDGGEGHEHVRAQGTVKEIDYDKVCWSQASRAYYLEQSGT